MRSEPRRALCGPRGAGALWAQEKGAEGGRAPGRRAQAGPEAPPGSPHGPGSLCWPLAARPQLPGPGGAGQAKRSQVAWTPSLGLKDTAETPFQPLRVRDLGEMGASLSAFPER